MSVEVITRNLSGSDDGDGHSMPPVLLELERQEMPLRELIALTVVEQVHELTARLATQKPDAEARGQVSGYYLLAGVDERDVPATDDAVAKALAAFERNRFLVMIDDHQVTDLDEMVAVPAGTSVTFLRLLPLKGG